MKHLESGGLGRLGWRGPAAVAALLCSSATSINGGNGTAASPGDFGGGGGGAGRIRINTGCGGALNINSSALLTPGSTTPCYSTGTLN
jgi:hypothetical protein